MDDAICKEIEGVEVSYCNQTDENAVVSSKFSFSVRVDMSTSTVKQLNKDTLYHLRLRHPVIDAVGYFEVNAQPWLLMMQVSLTPYAKHGSKAGDLLKPVAGDEANYYKPTV